MKALLIVLSLLALPLTADAFTCTATGCTFTIKYTEPTQNTSGGPVNLQSTKIYYRLDNGSLKAVNVPASSPAGGQVISKDITEPILPGQKVVISGQVTASNAAGEGAASPTAALTIDLSGQVVPAVPSGFTIQ